MKSTKTVLMAVGLMLACGPAWSQAAAPPPAPAPGTRASQANWWSQAGGDAGGPTRIVWAGQKTPETPYTGPNKPIWHIADILKAHQGQARWEQKVLLNRDFDGRYVQMAPGDKSKCIFYADDRVFGWVYSGQVKITIDGQEPKTLPKGWVFNVAPRLSYCMETVGTEPVVFYRTAPAGQVPSYPESETPTPIPGYKYVKVKINSTGGYDSFNVPFFNVDEYGASDRRGDRFLYDGHTSSNLNLANNITELPPSTSWGHFHENMQEVWLDVYGSVCALISGEGVVHGEYGDLINANEERWHRATSCANTGKSIRMAMTPRSKEGQVHYFQTDQPPGN
ncbi:MAG TPA: hypothetical protein VK776_03045 [Bryobacteraceae bacterium]|nr:hypothetical protein [Bryobacteraceae bacterium]